MTKSQFEFYKANGNFTLTEGRILEVGNHIAEQEHRAYTKKEAAEVAVYWMISCGALRNAVQTKIGELQLCIFELGK